MAFSSTTNRVPYAGNGSTVAFSFPYYFALATDIRAVLYNTTTGVSTPLTNGTDFSVSGTVTNGEFASGGTVTTTVAPPTGTNIVIYRDPPPVQNITLTDNNPFPAKSIETNFDYVMGVMQRVREMAYRCFKLPDGFSTSFDTTLPGLLSPDCVIQINDAGTGLSLGPNVSAITGAANSAAAAAASATAAAGSATAAAASVTSAAGSATTAGSSATAAAASATAAASSAAAAAASVSPTIVGTSGAPLAITAAGGIPFTATTLFTKIWISGSGGAVTVTKNPQVAAGTSEGQRLRIVGGANNVTLADGTGLKLNGGIILSSGTILDLDWDAAGSLWWETGRINT